MNEQQRLDARSLLNLSNEIPTPDGTTVHYVDIKGDGHDRERGDAALQADTRTCGETAGKNIEACLRTMDGNTH